ncbi:MAG: YbaN family protein [Actinomycetota bacterium]|nr:YbaN family protein [Actinomycetota bacterium]
MGATGEHRDPGDDRPAPPVRRGPVAWLWFGAGWLAVGLGALGVIVPGLPTTVFFIVAAWCFARCSPRFEQWVLDLPRIGPMVRDHRAGLGMPRRAKAVAVAMIVLFAGGSGLFLIDNRTVGAVVIAVGLVGVAYVTLRVPTREKVLAQRSTASP